MSGQGSIVKLGKDHYRVFVTVPTTGKRKTKVVRGSKRDAENVRIRMLIEAGIEPESEMTFGEFVNIVYLPAKKAEVKRSTYLTYEEVFNRDIIPAIGHVSMSKLTPTNIRSMIDGFSQAKAKYVRTLMHGACNFAVYEGYTRDNPAAKVKPIAASDYEPEVLDEAGVREYLRIFYGSKIEAGVLLAAGCGLRRGEICALDVEDIGEEVSISKNYIVSHNEFFIDTPKTRNGIRKVAVPPSILRRLSQILPESGPIMVDAAGDRLTPSAFYSAYRKALRALQDDVPYIPLKNLRHTSLTLAYENGADLLDVSLRAGHSGTGITARYYIRQQSNRRDRKTAYILDDVFRVQQCAAETETIKFRVIPGTLERF